MVEPTESESMHELDRFIDAMIQIRDEIRAVEEGKLDSEDNPLLNAPHTAAQVSASEWTRSYPRERSEEHTSELQSLMRISYAVFCLKKKKKQRKDTRRKPLQNP